jgi:hypothetical protein
MTTKIFRNGSGDWTIKTINYPDGWRAIASLVNHPDIYVDGYDEEEDAIDAAKDECNQYFLNS